MRRIGFVLLALVAILLSLGTVAFAQEEEQYLDGKLRFGDNITISSDERIDGDLYVFGGDINVDGDVTGDLVVFGGTVSIAGEIGGDLLVGAGTVELSGSVLGDIRAGAGQVTLRGDVGEDILAGTGQLRADGDVGGDIIFGAGLVDIGGTVAGDVLGWTGSYSVSGEVLGTEDVTIEDTDRDIDVERPNVFVRGLSRFASLLLLGLLIMWLRRHLFERSVDAVDSTPGPTALWGFGFLFGLVAVPLGVTLAGVLLAILFGWLGLGLVVGVIVFAVVLSWILAVAMGFVVIAVLAPITIAAWLGNRFLPEETAGYLALAAGLAALVILGLVPVLNVLVWFAVTIMGGGAWLSLVRRVRPPTGAPVEV
jgi:hypothetical protein